MGIDIPARSESWFIQYPQIVGRWRSLSDCLGVSRQGSFSFRSHGTVLKETQKPPPPSGIPGPFSLADQTTTETALSETGFRDIAIERMNVIFTYDSPEEYTRFHQAIFTPAHALIA